MLDLINDILGTFLGALLGIPAGLAVNHAWQYYADRDRRRQLLDAITRSVNQNDYLVGQVEDWLNKGGAPYFNMDMPLLESTSSLKYELLDVELCQKLDHLRFELDHLARKVDLLLKLEYDPTARLAMPGPNGPVMIYDMLRPGLAQAIQKHIPPIRKTAGELKAKLAEVAQPTSLRGYLKQVFRGKPSSSVAPPPSEKPSP
jgi:hypothetical protein